MKKVALLIIIISVLVGCTKTVFLNNDYLEVDFSGQNLNIVMLAVIESTIECFYQQ